MVQELAVGSVRQLFIGVTSVFRVDTSVVNVDMEPTFVGIEVEALKTLNELYIVHFLA